MSDKIVIGLLVGAKADTGLDPSKGPQELQRRGLSMQMSIESCIMSKDTANTSAAWTESTLLARMGFPVKFRLYKPKDDEPSPPNFYNVYAHYLSLDVDTKSDTFGKYTQNACYQQIMVIRCDGKPLRPAELVPLMMYINDNLIGHVEDFWNQPTQRLKDRWRATMQYYIHPPAIASCWKAVREHAPPGKFPDWFWNGIECPITKTERSCEDYGAEKCPDGEKLMKCGKCGEARYCSKECQTNDWTLHKIVCKRLKESGLKQIETPVLRFD